MNSTLIQNRSEWAGAIAGGVRIFGERSRYKVAAVHTRFEEVSWFVWDAEKPDEEGMPSIIRQEATEEAAVKGLVTR